MHYSDQVLLFFCFSLRFRFLLSLSYIYTLKVGRGFRAFRTLIKKFPKSFFSVPSVGSRSASKCPTKKKEIPLTSGGYSKDPGKEDLLFLDRPPYLDFLASGFQ